MNCKQGDMAMLVRTIVAPQHIGKVVRCVESLNRGWVIEPKLPNPTGFDYWWADDACLIPIRDPGEDARDQTLDWLPVPSKEGETA